MSARTRDLPRRSCLSVPGSSEKMMGKAPNLGADMVFLDLEDAVAPLEKEAARDKVVKAINDLKNEMARLKAALDQLQKAA